MKNETESKLDELLENPELKAEYEARLQEAVEAALAEAGNSEAGAEDQNAEETEPDEEAENEQAAGDGKEAGSDEERLKNLDTREKNLLMRELKATAIEELAKEQLPAALADCFSYESEEAFRQSKDKTVEAFQNALQEAVHSRLRGGRTPKSSGDGAKGKEARKTSFAETINSMKAKR